MYKEYFQEFPDLDRIDTPVFEALYKIDCKYFLERLEVINQIRISRDLNQATGSTLDLLGKEIDLLRPPGWSDDDYRILIQIKIYASMSKSDLESINRIMTLVAKNYVGAEEGWHSVAEEPGLILIYLKDKIDHITKYILDIIKPGGVAIFPTIASDPIELFSNLITYEFPVELRITEMFRTETEYIGSDFDGVYFGDKEKQYLLYFGNEDMQKAVQFVRNGGI